MNQEFPGDSPRPMIALAVTGSIAAHKAIDLASQLTSDGYDVRVILTEDARRFVTDLPFKTLTRNPVITDLYDEEEGWKPAHVRLADEASLLLVAPASANTLARLANGLAGDALGCVYLALRPGVPVILAPAMNGRMWEHPATQKNLNILLERGASLVSPASGMLSCGYEGVGRLAALEDIRKAVHAALPLLQ